MMPSGSARRGGTLITGLAILEVLGRSNHKGLGVTELAAEVDGDKANVHRILSVLREQGYVQQDEDTKRYSMTARILEMAGKALRQLDVRQVAEPVMNDVQEETGESVHLALRTPRGGIYIAQVRAPNVISVETAIGAQPPLHCTATGKALFAHAQHQELARLLGSEPFESFTANTITTFEGLLPQLEHVRRRGFALDDEEYNPEVRCVAAPIFGVRGETIASIGVSGPLTRMSDDRLREVGSLLADAAQRITVGLGGVRPDDAYAAAR